LDGIAGWWDGVELWLTQLPFALQFPLMMAIMLPTCLGVARLIDRVVDRTSAKDPVEPVPVEEPEKVSVGPTS
jgi:hypothetical protein